MEEGMDVEDTPDGGENAAAAAVGGAVASFPCRFCHRDARRTDKTLGTPRKCAEEMEKSLLVTKTVVNPATRDICRKCSDQVREAAKAPPPEAKKLPTVQATGQKRKGSTMLGSTMLGSSEATVEGEVLSPSTGASARVMSSSQRATESAKGTETRSSLTAPATTKKVLPELEPCGVASYCATACGTALTLADHR
jgi:hypothetical protein